MVVVSLCLVDDLALEMACARAWYLEMALSNSWQWWSGFAI